MSMYRRTVRKPGAVGAARRQRRLTAWDDQVMVAGFTATSGGGNAVLLAENVSDPEKRGCTVVRLLARLTLAPATPGAVSGVQTLAMGILTMSDDAYTASAFADPEQDADYPVGGWLYRDVVTVRDETLASGIVAFPEVVLDLRAQRKLDRSTLAFRVFNSALEGTAFTVRITGIIRVLYKLP